MPWVEERGGTGIVDAIASVPLVVKRLYALPDELQDEVMQSYVRFNQRF